MSQILLLPRNQNIVKQIWKKSNVFKLFVFVLGFFKTKPDFC